MATADGCRDPRARGARNPYHACIAGGRARSKRAPGRAQLCEHARAFFDATAQGSNPIAGNVGALAAKVEAVLADRLRQPLDEMARDAAFDVPNCVRAAYLLRQLQARSQPDLPFKTRGSRGFPRDGGSFRAPLDVLAWVDALGARYSCIECRFLWPVMCR